MKLSQLAPVLVAASVLLAGSAEAGSLRGSPTSMKTQHKVAVDEDMTFLDTPAELRKLVEQGVLERLESSDDVSLSGVSFPYARPAVLVFIERLSRQYRAETGERLVVTSLTRPADLQPKNAHQLSVHPAGMAVDFRVPSKLGNRIWLEKSLLGLEESKVLDVTREHLPPHYHVAVFPNEYMAYVRQKTADEPPVIAADPAPAVSAAQPTPVVLPIAPPAGDASAPFGMFALVAVLTSVLGAIGYKQLASRNLSATKGS